MIDSNFEVDPVEAAARELAGCEPGYNTAVLKAVLRRYFPGTCTAEMEKSVLRRCIQIRESRSSEVQD